MTPMQDSMNSLLNWTYTPVTNAQNYVTSGLGRKGNLDCKGVKDIWFLCTTLVISASAMCSKSD